MPLLTLLQRANLHIRLQCRIFLMNFLILLKTHKNDQVLVISMYGVNNNEYNIHKCSLIVNAKTVFLFGVKTINNLETKITFGQIYFELSQKIQPFMTQKRKKNWLNCRPNIIIVKISYTLSGMVCCINIKIKYVAFASEVLAFPWFSYCSLVYRLIRGDNDRGGPSNQLPLI